VSTVPVTCTGLAAVSLTSAGARAGPPATRTGRDGARLPAAPRRDPAGTPAGGDPPRGPLRRPAAARRGVEAARRKQPAEATLPSTPPLSSKDPPRRRRDPGAGGAPAGPRADPAGCVAAGRRGAGGLTLAAAGRAPAVTARRRHRGSAPGCPGPPRQ